jgi:hypothetical protein
MKVFISEYFGNYYRDWIYLGSAGNEDFYLESLPSKESPQPSYSIVYGKNPSENISTTVSVSTILDDDKFYKVLAMYVKEYHDSSMWHMFAFIREYDRLQKLKLAVK